MTSPNIDFLYANGCSWAEGVGLEKDPSLCGKKIEDIKKFYQKYSWPGRLADLIGCHHQNDGFGAGSNQRIVRTTCDFIKKHPKDRYGNLLVVIGWTSPERDEICIEMDAGQDWLIFNPLSHISVNPHINDRYSEIIISNLARYHEIYLKYIQSNRHDLKRFYQNVYLMANLLENLGIKYLFFSSFGGWSIGNNLIDNPFKEFEKERSLMSKPQFMGMNSGYTMVSFCRKNQLPLSDCLHPMMAGHDEWAKNLRNIINDIF